ncbi:MAG: TIGR03013 family PEP-CTERM/XrtA system glycosyltransferase [Gammaproteobacteria bacterium]|nr:TIGR03013 family PEP-CTERM/XrtA system glycosyltransferase [Gammaproteobacteria bacterium]
MLRIFRHYIPKTLVLLGLAELLILFVSIYLGATFHIGSETVSGYVYGEGLPLWSQALVFAAAIVLGMTAMGLYRRDQRTQPAAVMVRLVLSFACGFVLMGTAYLVYPNIMVGGATFAVALVCSFVGIATCRLICVANDAAEAKRRVLVLGTGASARQIENLRHGADRTGVSIVGYVDLGGDDRVVAADRIFELTGSGLWALVEELKIEEIVVGMDDRRKGLPVDEILKCKMHGIHIMEAADFYERQLGKIRLDALHPSNVIFADGFTQAVLKITEKRVMDIAISSFMIILTLPVMAAVAIAIYMEGGGPILYRQERVGRRAKRFTLLKFRSMRQDAERDGVVCARLDDERVTRVGRFIRKTRIDELPQLINVLEGAMSFVGPRPERPQFVEEFSKAIPYYDLRHYIKPGITGWAQILYPYGVSLNDAREKLQYDLYYLKNYSVFLDITILLQTIQVILWGKGAR